MSKRQYSARLVVMRLADGRSGEATIVWMGQPSTRHGWLMAGGKLFRWDGELTVWGLPIFREQSR